MSQTEKFSRNHGKHPTYPFQRHDFFADHLIQSRASRAAVVATPLPDGCRGYLQPDRYAGYNLITARLDVAFDSPEPEPISQAD